MYEMSREEMIRFGFLELMEEGASVQSVPGFEAAFLEEHPFGVEVPDGPMGHPGLVLYVGQPGYTESSVKGAIRLISWEIANGCIGSSTKPYFLGVVEVESDPHDRSKHHIYYHIGIGSYFIVSSGCTDCSGEGGAGRQRMESVFLCLSSIFDIPVNRMNIPYEKGKDIYNKVQQALEEYAKENPPQRSRSMVERPEEMIHHFHEGQLIRPNSEGERHLSDYDKEKVFGDGSSRVMKVEEIPERCSCGLGDEAPLALHPEVRCHLRVRFECCHPQLVYLTSQNGLTRRYSGHWFEPLPV